MPVARLLRPQGRRGELLAEPLTDQAQLFAPGCELWLAAAGASVPVEGVGPRTIESSWEPTGRNAGRWVLKLDHCDSINEAEALAGRELLAPSSAFPPLDADTYFVGDLVGCALLNHGAPVGVVSGVEFPTTADGQRMPDAAPLLAITLIPTEPAVADGPDHEPVLVPFIRAWIDIIDLPGKRIAMHLPEGLLDP
jgi:16S rRNA processing protein RimM